MAEEEIRFQVVFSSGHADALGSIPEDLAIKEAQKKQVEFPDQKVILWRIAPDKRDSGQVEFKVELG